MNGNPNRRKPEIEQRLDFENSREIERIRENEKLERQRRAKRIAQNKRLEMRKRARIKRIKETISAWAILLGIVAVIIAVICMIVSSCNKTDENDGDNVNRISAEMSEAIKAFEDFDGKVYTQDGNAMYKAADSVYALSVENSLNASYTNPSAFLWNVKQFAPVGDREGLRKVKDSIRDFPQFSNGYIWSSLESMKFGYTGNYLYDTNARFISAVCEICLWEADTSFLYEIDMTASGRFDASGGKSVLDKLEEAVAYFFDKNDLNGGGIRYNESDGLVYVLTTANSALSDGAGSNYWFNHRFGYLDCYNNIAFNQAMTDLSKLYSLMGLPDKSQEYALIAEKNRTGINSVFWNESRGRYIGAKDTNGNTHDLGFTFLNLEAVASGVADSKKAKKIFSWIDGETTVNSDTSKGEDIYALGFAPRSTTVTANDSWWDYADGKCPLSGACAYGEYYQNGGASAVTAYFDVASRRLISDKEGLKKRIVAIGEYTAEIADAITEKSENGVITGAVVSTLFDLSTDGSRLHISPYLTVDAESYTGIKGVNFGTGTYNFMFGNNTVVVTAVSESPVRLTISGFNKNAECEVQIVRNGVVEITEALTADENGVLSLSERFGGTSLLLIKQPMLEKENKKK